VDHFFWRRIHTGSQVAFHGPGGRGTQRKLTSRSLGVVLGGRYPGHTGLLADFAFLASQ
jgi:hypothetical protein